ncbi:MAG TPA: heparan-alpha-glucosaminide N-acetyltransferase domain-containing protein, partial [bacterium]|nr:heparan-alpha-glucosaminide N-acetyltransferase domain-containing protein [bacterium]
MTDQLRAKQRIAYIDFAKGLACCMMLIGHALSPNLLHMGIPGWLLVSIVTVAAPMFFFASGMNVVTFNDAYSHKPGFQVAKFYLAAAAVLYVLSYTYTINRLGFGMWQIFQCIAVSTGLTLLLVRWKLPTWAMLMVFFAGYMIWFRFWNMINIDLAIIRAVSEDRQIFTESVKFIQSLPPLMRYTFAHFSLLPWV